MARFKKVGISITSHATYQLSYTNHLGRQRRLRVGKDERYAQKLRLKLEDWLLDGKDPERELKTLENLEAIQETKLLDFFPTFMERHGSFQSQSMQRRYQVFMDNLQRDKTLSSINIGGVTKGALQEYIHRRLSVDGLQPATVNRETAFIHCMLQRAVEWDMLDKNPLHGIRKLREFNKRDVNVTPEQIEQLASRLTPPMASIVRFAVYTGLRRENILGLQIDDIEFFDLRGSSKSPIGKITIRVKGGRIDSYPLGNHTEPILKEAIGHRSSGYVFINPRTGDRYREISKSFFNAVRELGITATQDGKQVPLRFHDLRHVFVTWLVQRGVPRDIVRDLVGHQSVTTTDLYTTVDRMKAGEVLALLPPLTRAG